MASHSFANLFGRPGKLAAQGMELLPEILDQVMPQNSKQFSQLPAACQRLSKTLTSERSDLDKSYWATPALTSAYLRFFLPWNLVRMCALLPNLPLGMPPADARLADLGSGPLTFPLALFLSKPEWHALPLHLTAVDSSPHILKLGLRIVEMARDRLAPDCAWSFEAVRAPFSQVRRWRGKIWLLGSANILNEWSRQNPGKLSLEERLGALAGDFYQALMPHGKLLALEPGTRLGGKLISGLRDVAVGGLQHTYDEDIPSQTSGGFAPLSPCLPGAQNVRLHVWRCPLHRPGVSAWCHFNASAFGAPKWLRQLSAKAGLDKESVSLSFALLGKGGDENSRSSQAKRGEPLAAHGLWARVISDAFSLPGRPGRARYACTGRELVLIVNAAALASGSLVEVALSGEKDGKSGAAVAILSQDSCAAVLRGDLAGKSGQTSAHFPAGRSKLK